MSMGERRAESVSRDAAITVGGRLLLAVLILALDVALARLLGRDGRGAFALVLIASQLSAVLFGLGFDRALGVVAARSVAVARAAYANAAVWICIGGGAAVVLGLMLLGMRSDGSAGAPLAGLVPNLPASHLVLGILAIPLEIAFAVGMVGFLGRRRIVAYNGGRLLQRGTLLALVVSVAAFGTLDLGAALVLNLVALAATLIVIVAATAREGVLGWRPDVRLLREQLGFGARSVIGTLAERVHLRIDAFLINLALGVGATGVYAVATGVAEVLWYVPHSLGAVLFSRGATEGTESAATASAATRRILALAAALALPVAVAAPTVVEALYGAPFVEAAAALRAMLPGIVAYSAVAVLAPYVVARGRPGTVTLVFLAGLTANLAANAVLIPAAGLVGAGVAASISYGLTGLLMVAAFMRVTGQGLAETIVLRAEDVRRAGRVPAR